MAAQAGVAGDAAGERRYSQQDVVIKRRRQSMMVLETSMNHDHARSVMMRLENTWCKRDIMRAFGRWKQQIAAWRAAALSATARDALVAHPPGDDRCSGAVAAMVRWARQVHTQSFERCEDHDLADTFRHVTLHQLNAGEPLFLEGDPGEHFVLMFRGSVAIFVAMPAASAAAVAAHRATALLHEDLLNGGAHSATGGFIGDRVHTFLPGTGFGEVGISTNGKPTRRSASAVAAEDGTEVLLVPAHVFARSLQHGFGDRRYKRLAALSSLFLFRSWNRARLISLAVRMQDRTVRHGEPIVRAGDELPGLVVIVSGSVTTASDVGTAAEAAATPRQRKRRLRRRRKEQQQQQQQQQQSGGSSALLAQASLRRGGAARKPVELAILGEGDMFGMELVASEFGDASALDGHALSEKKGPMTAAAMAARRRSSAFAGVSLELIGEPDDGHGSGEVLSRWNYVAASETVRLVVLPKSQLRGLAMLMRPFPKERSRLIELNRARSAQLCQRAGAQQATRRAVSRQLQRRLPLVSPLRSRGGSSSLPSSPALAARTLGAAATAEAAAVAAAAAAVVPTLGAAAPALAPALSSRKVSSRKAARVSGRGSGGGGTPSSRRTGRAATALPSPVRPSRFGARPGAGGAAAPPPEAVVTAAPAARASGEQLTHLWRSISVPGLHSFSPGAEYKNAKTRHRQQLRVGGGNARGASRVGRSVGGGGSGALSGSLFADSQLLQEWAGVPAASRPMRVEEGERMPNHN